MLLLMLIVLFGMVLKYVCSCGCRLWMCLFSVFVYGDCGMGVMV